MADALLAREVLDADQVRRLAAGLPLDEPQPVAARTVVDEDEPRARPKERAPIVPVAATSRCRRNRITNWEFGIWNARVDCARILNSRF